MQLNLFIPRVTHSDRLAQRFALFGGRLNASTTPQDMDLPGLFMHPLKGKFRGRWSVRVSGNWRITYKFEGLDAVDVDYEDYH